MVDDHALSSAPDRDVRDRLLREHLAAEVRAEAARRRISGRQLARQLGESPGWTQKRLSAKTAMDTDDLSRIARTLGVSLRHLMLEALDRIEDVPDTPTGPRHRR